MVIFLVRDYHGLAKMLIDNNEIFSEEVLRCFELLRLFIVKDDPSEIFTELS